jgi:hypothetical protein
MGYGITGGAGGFGSPLGFLGGMGLGSPFATQSPLMSAQSPFMGGQMPMMGAQMPMLDPGMGQMMSAMMMLMRMIFQPMQPMMGGLPGFGGSAGGTGAGGGIGDFLGGSQGGGGQLGRPHRRHHRHKHHHGHRPIHHGAHGGSSPSTGGSSGGTPAAAGGSSDVPAVGSGDFGGSTKWGAEMAKFAEKNAHGPGDMCYHWVKEALAKEGIHVTGVAAYEAADQLARSKRFKEIKVNPKDLAKLPAGAVVVWNKGNGHQYGHISIALGNGKEASDVLRTQITNYGTTCRVFLPRP